MSELLGIISPEIILTTTACVLFLLGCSNRVAFRRATPFLTGLALVVAGLVMWPRVGFGGGISAGPLRSDSVADYLRILTIVVALILLLLAWPWKDDQTGNEGLDYGPDAGEFFGLFLLSITGLLLTTVANDLMILFLALELVSIPTYVMVSMSRPLPMAQEAGVKYFFLGAMSAALMLFGFSYLYGTTGEVNFDKISASLRASIDPQTGRLPALQLMAVVLVLIGFAYKMAAFPLHFYAGDVYEGAATPVTAFLAFVPKTAGFIATIRLLQMVGGVEFAIPAKVVTLLWVVAALTMTIGNVLALLQTNVKRVLAYSSVAHSGYMLVGLAAISSTARQEALAGVLFYLAAYGLMNAGAFGVLMLLPARELRFGYGLGEAGKATGAAETFDDLAGQGRRHPALGMAMAVCCFSLIGLPLTVGFWGKLMLISPALKAGMIGLVIITVINAAISAAYYLRIVAAMFLRGESASDLSPVATEGDATDRAYPRSVFAGAAVIASVAATLLLGSVPQLTESLSTSAKKAASVAAPLPPPGSFTPEPVAAIP